MVEIPIDPRTGMAVEVSFDALTMLPTTLRRWLLRRRLDRIGRQLRTLSDSELSIIGLRRSL